MHNSFDQIYSNLKHFESELSKAQSETYQLKTEIEKLKAALVHEKKENQNFSEKIKAIEISTHQEKTLYSQEIERLKKKEAELKEQGKLFSNSLLEVRKSLNNAQEHFQKQKESYEEQLKVIRLNQLVDQNKLKEAHGTIEKYKESQEKILIDLRRTDVYAKKSIELEKKLEKLSQEYNKIHTAYQRKSTDYNALQLELSKQVLRNQQLTDDLKKFSSLSNQSKKHENEWKEVCKKLKKEIFSLTESIRKKEHEVEQLKTQLHHHEISPFEVIETVDQKVTSELNQEMPLISKSTPPPMSPEKLNFHQKNEKLARTQLWDKKREIVRMELKIREYPQGHPQKLRMIDELAQLKDQRENLQKNLNEISKKLMQPSSQKKQEIQDDVSTP